MTLQERKLQLTKTLLETQDEGLISEIELFFESLNHHEKSRTPLSQEQLRLRVYQSEQDFREKNYKTAEDLMAKYGE